MSVKYSDAAVQNRKTHNFKNVIQTFEVRHSHVGGNL